MQFQNNALSQSFSASLPRDQFLISAFTPADEEEAAQSDELEERRLRNEERKRQRENRSRRPSTLHSFISGERPLSPQEEEQSDDEEALDDEDESYLDGDSDEEARVLGTSTSSAAARGKLGSSLGVPPAHLNSSLNGSVGRASGRNVHPTESSPLLGSSIAGRRASMATLTPGPLQRVFKGPSANPSRKELTILTWYTIPIFLTHLLEYSLLLATIVSVGHLGTRELAASSLGSMTTNVCALSIIQGLCAALDTLCSQAASSSNRKNTSLFALRTVVLTVIILIPSSIIILNGERLLLALKQDPEVAKLAGRYLRVLVFGLPGYAGFEISRRWLQAQGLMIVPTISLIIASPINMILNYLLVWGPESIRLGFIGAPISTAISFNVMFLISMIYCVWFAPRDCWGGWTWDMFKDLKPNFVLGLAGFASIASEWFAWEVVGISSAYLGTANLGANSVLGTSASLLYQLPYGLSVAAAVRVGNLVGAGLPHTARLSTKVAMYMSVIIGLFNSSLLIFAKNSWGRLFSSDEEVVVIVAAVIPLVGLFQLTDGVSGAAAGILRGTGLAKQGATINIVAYWIIGLPIGLALSFSKLQWQLYGLWTGLTIALTFTAVASSIIIARIDWNRVVREAKSRDNGPGLSPSGIQKPLPSPAFSESA